MIPSKKQRMQTIVAIEAILSGCGDVVRVQSECSGVSASIHLTPFDRRSRKNYRRCSCDMLNNVRGLIIMVKYLTFTKKSFNILIFNIV